MFGPDDVRRRWRPEEITVTEPDVTKRAIGAAAIGNITEWHDFGVDGYLAVVIEGIFLPKDSGPPVMSSSPVSLPSPSSSGLSGVSSSVPWPTRSGATRSSR